MPRVVAVLLRADNADQRLTPMAMDWGIVSSSRRAAFEKKQSELSLCRSILQDNKLSPNEAAKHDIKINLDGRKRTAMELLAYKDVSFDVLALIWPQLSDIAPAIREQMEIEALYAGYMQRQEMDIAAFRKDENLVIPDALNYDDVGGLSNEVKSKLTAARPATLGQASRIEGVTPGAIAALLPFVKKQTGKTGS